MNFSGMLKAFLFLLLFLSSCTPSKKTERSDVSANSTNTIFFFVFKISKNSVQGKNAIELVSKTPAAGKIKKEDQDQTNFQNSLNIDLFEEDSLIKRVVIEHPLFKHVEYADSNNALASKFIELDKADFFLRLQITERSTMIRISEKLQNKNLQELTIIKL